MPRELIISREAPNTVLKAYACLCGQNINIPRDKPDAWIEKGKIAKEMGQLYRREMFHGFEAQLSGSDNVDVNVGTLSGTLVAQRTLELFRLQFPVFSRIYTDFSNEPGLFNQAMKTRVVVTPPLATYNPGVDGYGRTIGWANTTPAKAVDVLVTMDEHIGVPIILDSNMLAGTTRHLFDEQAPACTYVMAKHFVEKLYAVMTPANFNAYGIVVPGKVPLAYASYKVAANNLARSSMVQLASIFNPNEVPIANRTCLLNSQYFGSMAEDPSLVTFFAGQQHPEIITDNELPKLGTFVPMEAPNLTANNATPNLVGFAMHRAGIVAKARPSAEYANALGELGNGRVVTVTDPDLNLSVSLVQYVNHDGGYSVQRMQAMIGAAPGDTRGGLCILGQ